MGLHPLQALTRTYDTEVFSLCASTVVLNRCLFNSDNAQSVWLDDRAKLSKIDMAFIPAIGIHDSFSLGLWTVFVSDSVLSPTGHVSPIPLENVFICGSTTVDFENFIYIVYSLFTNRFKLQTISNVVTALLMVS